jgi:hypothetical protein
LWLNVAAPGAYSHPTTLASFVRECKAQLLMGPLKRTVQRLVEFAETPSLEQMHLPVLLVEVEEAFVEGLLARALQDRVSTFVHLAGMQEGDSDLDELLSRLESTSTTVLVSGCRQFKELEVSSFFSIL